MYKIIFISIIIFLRCHAYSQMKFNGRIMAELTGNIQSARSSLYFLGTGMRFELSPQKANNRNTVFYQAGYTYFIKKPDGAFTANVIQLNAGLRHQSRGSFYYSGAIGLQMWNESMKIDFPQKKIRESFYNLVPAANVAMGWLIKNTYFLNVELRQLYRVEPGDLFIAHHIVVSFGCNL